LEDELVATHLQELRRGTIVVACLALLDAPRYGYDLLDALPGAGLTVDGNTLYPLLRRLEAQGLLTSEWNTDQSRPRKFYRTSAAGRQLLTVLRDEWRSLDTALDPLLKEDA
jgi:DNA-binding PadR family transcriptional regulator